MGFAAEVAAGYFMILKVYVVVNTSVFMCKRLICKYLFSLFRKSVSTIYWTVCSPIVIQIGTSKYALVNTFVAEFAATVGGLNKDQLHTKKIDLQMGYQKNLNVRIIFFNHLCH